MLCADFHHRCLTETGDHGAPSAEGLIQLCVTAVHHKAATGQARQFFGICDDHDILQPHFPQHAGTELLIAATEDVPLSADDGDHNGRLASLHQLVELLLVHVGCDDLPLIHHVNTQ